MSVTLSPIITDNVLPSKSVTSTPLTFAERQPITSASLAPYENEIVAGTTGKLAAMSSLSPSATVT